MPRALKLFEGVGLTLAQAIDLTVENLLARVDRYRHWAVAMSGGKDSTTVAALLARLIADGRIPAPESLTFLLADTRQEVPPLMLSAMDTLSKLEGRGFQVRVVLPKLEHRYWCYTLGRGVVFPSNRTRWCTPKLKVEPMMRALAETREQAGEKLLMLTGVRMGESAVRDERIITSCSKDGAECGQGWFQSTTPDQVADTLAPILHWRVCQVWDYLAIEAPQDGFDTHMLAKVYGGDEATESAARTGCIGCRLVTTDRMMKTVLKIPEWAYLAPLEQLRPLTDELMRKGNRLRKVNERKKDGSIAAKPGRVGPLTLAAREWGLERVLAIQAEVNDSARQLGRPEVSIVNAEEEAFIRACIAAGIFPDKWDGTEPTGDELYEQTFATGASQPILDGLKAG